MNKPRFNLGVIFNFDSRWMGGVIYIINLINTLNFLDDDEKPKIILFYRADLSRFLDEMKYTYLRTVEWTFPPMAGGSIKSMILGRNIFIDKILKKYPLDAVYPLQDYPVKTRTPTKLVSWCTDFQYCYYPEFFSRTQIIGRNMRTRLALKNNDDLVLSSHDACNDLKKFFRVREDLNIHIFHFVSVIEDLESANINDLKAKYKLPDKYFMISNQFHRHKNHRVLMLAQSKLKRDGIKIHMAMTGKFPEATDSLYLSELHSILNDNKLHDQVTMLGLIPRKDQLQLMKYSQGVLQPSLFEGWSTVIEDAKSLQVPVVASNLKVNIEQLGEKGVYFNPHNPDELASILMNYPERNLNNVFYEDYPKRMKEAARELMTILLHS